MANRDWENATAITQFIFLGFGATPQLHNLLFLLFLLIYVVTVAGNILIVVLVVVDPDLHTPMYFFLGNLSSVEACYSSAILPRLLASLLTGDRTISVGGCIAQFYFGSIFAAAECYLLAVMSYDRYLAICKPLRYATLMNGKVCRQLAAGSWINGSLAINIIAGLMLQLTFCGPNEIEHFFCDATQIVNLACTDTFLIEFVITLLVVVFTLPPFTLTVGSYMCIISTILRIPSTTGRRKTFSTCSSHLIVVTLFYGTLTLVYLLPKTATLRELNEVFSFFYTVLTPISNPFVYSLRNQKVKEALRKMARKCADFRRLP